MDLRPPTPGEVIPSPPWRPPDRRRRQSLPARGLGRAPDADVRDRRCPPPRDRNAAQRNARARDERVEANRRPEGSKATEETSPDELGRDRGVVAKPGRQERPQVFVESTRSHLRREILLECLPTHPGPLGLHVREEDLDDARRVDGLRVQRRPQVEEVATLPPLEQRAELGRQKLLERCNAVPPRRRTAAERLASPKISTRARDKIKSCSTWASCGQGASLRQWVMAASGITPLPPRER